MSETERSLPAYQSSTVYALIGNAEGCYQIALEFYKRVALDPLLRPLFPGKSMRCATEAFAAFLVQALDGDAESCQYRHWVSLKASHARFDMSTDHMKAWLGHMDATIDVCICDTELASSLKQFFQAAAEYLVGQPSTRIVHSELHERWGTQLTLDQIEQCIQCDEDAQVVQLLSTVQLGATVRIGIYARMMQSRRDVLVSHIVNDIAMHPERMNGQNNGFTILHFAAMAGCYSVVSELLSKGMDVDILDRGGYTPLYRVAGARNTHDAERIVRLLVNAGAAVNKGCGLNRTTALHQACRYGNVLVVDALLHAGANPHLPDKHGITAIERARNFKRVSLVERLTAVMST